MFPFSGKNIELNFLIVTFILIIIILVINDYTHIKKVATESFQDYYLTSCPPGYKSFYDKEGDIICCDGDIVAGKCVGNQQCTLNGRGTKDMPNCVQAILDDYKQKAKTQCPSSMSSYFEDIQTKTKGCTNGNLNDMLNGPKDSNQPKCIIYNNLNENINSKDSCYNLKMLDEASCFGNNCSKQIIQPSAGKPVLIGIGFTDNSGIYKMAYTRKSYENYLNAVNPSWRNQGIDLSKNINVAEVAKAFYVDKTLDQSQIQF